MGFGTLNEEPETEEEAVRIEDSRDNANVRFPLIFSTSTELRTPLEDPLLEILRLRALGIGCDEKTTDTS